MAGSLGLQNQWGHAHKILQSKNWNLMKTFTPEILVSGNYNEVPVQNVCLYFCHDISQFLFSLFLFFLLLKGVTSHPIQPL